MALRNSLHFRILKSCFLSSTIYKSRFLFELSIVSNERYSSFFTSSFFGGGQKKTSSLVSSSSSGSKSTTLVTDKRVSDTEDSPIKIRKKARIIDSESEDEDALRNHDCDKENDKVKVSKSNILDKNEEKIPLVKATESPQKENFKAIAIESPQKENIQVIGDTSELLVAKSPSISPSSSSKSNEELEPSSLNVPPLRKTARKQFKRKSSDSMEEQQIQKIKKLKVELKRIQPGKENKENSNMQGVGPSEKSSSEIPAPPKKKVSEEKITSKSKLSLFKFTPKAKTAQPKIGDMFNRNKETSSLNHSEIERDSPKVNKENSPKKDHLEDEDKTEKLPSPEKSTTSESITQKNICNEQFKKTPLKNEVFKSPKAKESPTLSKKSPKGSPKVARSQKKSPKVAKNSPTGAQMSPKQSSNTAKSPKKSPKNDIKSLKDDEDGHTKSTSLGMKVEEELNKSLNESSSSGEISKPQTPKLKNPFAKQPPNAVCTYNPSKKKYHPIDDAIWKKGERVPYMALAKTFAIIEDTSGRLKTIEILSNFLRSVITLTPEDLLPCIYLCLNKVAPAFDGIELNVGESFLMKAIAQSTGRSMERLRKDRDEYGDLGIVAEQSKSNQKMMFQPAPLNVRKVFGTLKEVGLMSGVSVQTKKVDKIKSMFVACKESEARFLIRSLSGKLRIGLAEQSVLQAIAQACFLTPPGKDELNNGSGFSAESLKAKIEEHALILKTTYCECPSYDIIVPVILEHGLLALPEHCKLTPGVPLQPMLAHPTKGVDEVLRRFENAKFTCEYKYDGERAQIHLLESGQMKIFSRNQEDNTSKYPDVINRIKESIGGDVTSFVMDSEAVAYDVAQDKILPFQILSTRKRKDAVEKEIKVQVCIFPFDLLYLNGKNLVQDTFEVRRNLLRENFKEVKGHLQFATSMDGTDTEEIQEFLDESIKGNCEGLMVKTLDIEATYEIAKRSRNWLKLKKDYLDGVGDTIDVVPIGGYMGKGKRVGVYGGFLLACYDPENEEYQSLCKIGTGFSEESLKEHTEFFKDHIIESPKSYYRCDPSLSPDHWFDADKVKVWEIKCADLSISPVYKAANGLVDPEKGISLRFPRFLRIRDDKTSEQATSAQQIADLYNSQDQIKNQNASKSKEDDDEMY